VLCSTHRGATNKIKGLRYFVTLFYFLVAL